MAHPRVLDDPHRELRRQYFDPQHPHGAFRRRKAYELINIYEDNWITEYDLDRIVELGFNCVRVPFWFRNFYYDDKGTKSLTKTVNGISAVSTGSFPNALSAASMLFSISTAHPDIRTTRITAEKSATAAFSS